MADEQPRAQDPASVLPVATFVMVMEVMEELKARDPDFAQAVAARWLKIADGETMVNLQQSADMLRKMGGYLLGGAKP